MVLITDPRERGKKQNLPARNAENTWQMRTTEATYLSFLVNGFKPHGSNWLMPSRECRRVKALSTVHVNKTLKQLRDDGLRFAKRLTHPGPARRRLLGCR